jgi:hypothetical protein
VADLIGPGWEVDMASIKVKRPRQRGAASQWAPRSLEKLSSAPPQSAPDIPNIPNPLGELPAEGTKASHTHQEMAPGSTSVSLGHNPDSPGDASQSIAPPSIRGRRGEKKSATGDDAASARKFVF